jgi:XTP/dITP diphosphohydrolase
MRPGDTSSTVLLATRSQGKLRELRPIFSSSRIRAIDLDEAGVVEDVAKEDWLEVFGTFEQNALAKARYFYEWSGIPTVADDSGLCVASLNDEPGVFSKRWSARPDLAGKKLDDENNRLLLERLRDVDDRRAHYVCVAAYADGCREFTRRGEVHGRICDTANGTGGFGYDPYFFSDELEATFGNASREEKERVSHRGRAFRELVAELLRMTQSEIRS